MGTMHFTLRTFTWRHFSLGVVLLSAVFLTTLCVTYPATVFAATLTIDPASGEFGPGDTFVLTVRVDPLDGECINAVAAEINYPKDWMRAVAVSKGESILTLWPDEPTVDTARGSVYFNGGTPAGYCGRVLGDPGKTNVLAKIVFSIPGNMIGGKVATGPEPLLLTFGPKTQVLLNDGFGTPAPLETVGGSYIRTMSSVGHANEWTDIVHADNISPDLFTVSVEQDRQTYQGKYFIVFSTLDKQSGVHHYEITEDDPNHFGFVVNKKEPALAVTAKSPYLLTDQTLSSRIIVRAFDHAGNMQEALVSPKSHSGAPIASESAGSNMMMWIAGILIGLLVIFGAFWFLGRREKTGGIPDAK